MSHQSDGWGKGNKIWIKGNFHNRIIIYVCAFSWLLTCSVTQATKCLKNDDIGDREGNVYFCEDSDKPECCEEGIEFTCCEDQGYKTMREQLILWGTVCAVGLVIAGLCLYFWKDIYCCRDDVPLSQKCCRCCKKNTDDQNALTPIPASREVTSYAPKAWPSNQFTVNEDGNETPPPFKFKSPSYNKY